MEFEPTMFLFSFLSVLRLASKDCIVVQLLTLHDGKLSVPVVAQNDITMKLVLIIICIHTTLHH